VVFVRKRVATKEKRKKRGKKEEETMKQKRKNKAFMLTIATVTT